MARCKGCDAEIVWFKTESGANIPLDAKSEKRIVLIGQPDGLVAKLLDTYMPHHATCSHVDEFRKKP